jgi:hypothetical protein
LEFSWPLEDLYWNQEPTRTLQKPQKKKISGIYGQKQSQTKESPKLETKRIISHPELSPLSPRTTLDDIITQTSQIRLNTPDFSITIGPNDGETGQKKPRNVDTKNPSQTPKKSTKNGKGYVDMGQWKPDSPWDKEEWSFCGSYCKWCGYRSEEHHCHYLKAKEICSHCKEEHHRYFKRCPELPEEDVPKQPEAYQAPSSSQSKAQGTLAAAKDDQPRDCVLKFTGRIEGQPARILIDSGASQNFMDPNLADSLRLSIKKNPMGKEVRLANGDVATSTGATKPLTVEIGDHSSTGHQFSLLSLGSYEAILGKPWLYDVNPSIDWRKNKMTIETWDDKWELYGEETLSEVTLWNCEEVLLSRQQMAKLADQEEVLAIFAKPEKPSKTSEDTTIPSKIQVLLEKFKDLFS